MTPEPQPPTLPNDPNRTPTPSDPTRSPTQPDPNRSTPTDPNNPNPNEPGQNPNREIVTVHSRLDYVIDLGGVAIAPGENKIKRGDIRRIQALPSYGFYADYLDGLPPPQGQPQPQAVAPGMTGPAELQTNRYPAPTARGAELSADGSEMHRTGDDEASRSSRRGTVRR